MQEYTKEQAESRRKCGQLNVPTRFFMFGMVNGELEQIEVTESEFMESDGAITYERHTVHMNGVNQIILFKDNL